MAMVGSIWALLTDSYICITTFISGPTKCARLQPVANAISEVLLGNAVDYPHGTVLRYRCKEGYTINGHSERHCKNGLWDDIKFNCTRLPEGMRMCVNFDKSKELLQ